MNIALIAFGANLDFGDSRPKNTVSEAVARLDTAPDRLVARSRLYQSPCFPPGAGPDYVNGAAAFETPRTPLDFLKRLHEVEREFGRKRDTRWGQRTLDLDLLAIGDQILPNETTFDDWADLDVEQQRLRAPDRLILPHPRMHERAFVLVPLLDVAADWVHPVFHKTVATLAQALSDNEKSAVIPL